MGLEKGQNIYGWGKFFENEKKNNIPPLQKGMVGKLFIRGLILQDYLIYYIF